MTEVAIVCGVIGVLGVAFGLRCYVELARWARQCQNARVAIAYNRKVQLQAPLSEWLMWANALGRDEASTGRVVYKQAKVSVAILRPAPRQRERIRGVIGRARGARRRRKAPQAQ